MAPPVAESAALALVPGVATDPAVGGGILALAAASALTSGKHAHVNEDTLKLIECVRSRPALWHRKHLRQRVQVAHRGWEEIRKAFKATEVASLKVRWKTLRDSFRREVKRMEDGEIATSSWPLFEKMSFLIGHFRTRESYYKSGSLSPEHAKSGDELWNVSVKHDSINGEDGSGLAGSLGDSDNVEVLELTRSGLKRAKNRSAETGCGSMVQDSDIEDLTMIESYECVHGEANPEAARGVHGDVIELPPHLYGEVTFKNKLRARIKTEPVDEERKVLDRSGFEMDSDYNFLMSLHPFMRKLPGKKNLAVRIGIQQLISEAMED